MSKKSSKLPDWWPVNPYPVDIFPMTVEQYAEAIPDEQNRTAISGCIGRLVWQMCSDHVWERMQQAKDDRMDSGPKRVASKFKPIGLRHSIKYEEGEVGMTRGTAGDKECVRVELNHSESGNGFIFGFTLNGLVAFHKLVNVIMEEKQKGN